ncbi:MAG: hypothetical protein O7C75_20040 [Verrucomicrobia bacterium]|nr:hypothetical protein [Verrucomicrobiota bacterium]
MIRLLRRFGIFVAFFSGNVLQANLWEQPFTDEQKNKLLAGEVVFLEPEPAYLIATAILIKAPESSVWNIMLDQERIPEYLKDCKLSQIKESGDTWKIVEHRMKVHPLLPAIQYVFREDYGSDYFIEFQRLSGNIKELKGWWKIVPNDDLGGVVLMYSVFVDVGWYIPKSWIKNGMQKRVPALLNAVRGEVYAQYNTTETEVPGP